MLYFKYLVFRLKVIKHRENNATNSLTNWLPVAHSSPFIQANPNLMQVNKCH